jgi:hypothetical protein
MKPLSVGVGQLVVLGQHLLLQFDRAGRVWRPAAVDVPVFRVADVLVGVPMRVMIVQVGLAWHQQCDDSSC